MRRFITTSLTFLTAFAVSTALESEARADFTVQASAGAPLVIGEGGGFGQATYEIGPGYQLSIVRFELPIVLTRAPFDGESGVDMVLGLRPSIKIFPVENLYAKASTSLTFGDHSSVGVGVGGGLEYRLADVIGLFGEAQVYPYASNYEGVPIELRAGVTVVF